MALGEILDRTAELYRSNFLLFAGISSIFAVIMLGIQLLYLRSVTVLGNGNMVPTLRLGTASAAVVQSLAVLLLAGLSIAANNRAMAWVYMDQPATISGAVQSVLPRLRRYLWLMTNVAFRAWGPLAALYIVFFAIIFAALPHDFMTNPAAVHTAPSHNPGALVGVLVGFLVLIPLFLVALTYGTWMSLRYSLSVPASVVEDLPTGLAIKRSVELSRGSLGRIFVLGLLVYAVRLLLGILFGFPIIALAFKHPEQPLPMGWMIFSEIGQFFNNAFIGPIYAIGLTLFYYDQRIRREGFDIEWMMRAAGLAPQSDLPAPQAELPAPQ
jgi:hypothetical protein